MTPLAPPFSRLSRLQLALLRVLKHAGPLPPDALASLLDCTHPTCARVIGQMARKKYIRKTGLGESTGGRRPNLWDVVPNSAFAAGLAIEVGRMKAVSANLSGEVLAREEHEFDVDMGAADFVTGAASILERVLEKARVPLKKLIGVGVAAPGVVDRRAGSLVFCAHYRDVGWWRDVPLLARLRDRIDAPFLLDYHSNACLLGEHWFGAQRGVANMIYIPVETQGLGAGILINGEVYRGAGGGAGEFGHITIEQNGRLCRCGSRGCLEAYVSGAEIVRKAQAIRKAGGQSSIFHGLAEDKEPTARAVAEAAQSGDRIGRGIIEEAGQVLGVGIANLVNLLNPSLVVIGGDVARGGEVLLDPVRSVVRRRALEKPAGEVQFLCADSSPDDILRGTIAMVLHETFGSPCHVQRLLRQTKSD
ncbi:MAG: ROK family transcriptional regulator [Planctomycetes bacterium]|nr:ROK family transcriptional regulator [Planctomycetota bacterium]